MFFAETGKTSKKMFMVSLNKHHLSMSLNRIYNRLGGFSCGRMADRGPRFLCLIAAGSATETCFSCLCCRFGGVGVGTGAALVAGSLGKFSSLLVPLILSTFLLLLIICFYGLVLSSFLKYFLVFLVSF